MRKILILLFIILAGNTYSQPIRGVWISPDEWIYKNKIDSIIEKLAYAKIKQIYPLVNNYGFVYYKTALLETHYTVEENFDPLKYLIELAKKYNIEVHPWFVNGPWGEENYPGPVFEDYPEFVAWNPANNTYGKYSLYWMDLTKPIVREFQKVIMIDCLERYKVDGLHFDYIRFPSSNFCYCDDCLTRYNESKANPYQFDMLRFEQLPAIGWFSGNPLGEVTTAKVLAKFNNGVPAITYNRYGEGKVLLFNWYAVKRQGRFIDSVVVRVFKDFGRKIGDTIYILRSWNTEKVYGYSDQAAMETKNWMKWLGFKSKDVEEGKLSSLSSKYTLVLPAVYRIIKKDINDLKTFIKNGGTALFWDGPVFMADDKNLRDVLGIWKTADYFNEVRIIDIAELSDFIPYGNYLIDDKFIEYYNSFDNWRKEQITELVVNVKEQAKKIKNDVKISAAVFWNIRSAHSVMQAWDWWFKRDILDDYHPMVYQENYRGFVQALNDIESNIGNINRLGVGLGAYLWKDKGINFAVAELDSQISELMRRNAKGFIIFNAGSLFDEQYEYLHNLDWTTSIYDSDNSRIKIFPNPVKNFISVDFSNNVKNVKRIIIFDINGRNVLSYDIENNIKESSGKINISLVKLPNGVYFLKTYPDELISSSFLKIK